MTEKQKDTKGTVRAEMYHRPPVSGYGLARRLEGTLKRLDEGEAVDSLDVSVWSPEVPVISDSEAVDAYRRFSEWADRQDVTIEPPFEVRQRRSRVLGETGEVLVTPSICLAVYLDEKLLAVFPHTADGGTVTVEDGLRELDVERRAVIREKDLEEQKLSV